MTLNELTEKIIGLAIKVHRTLARPPRSHQFATQGVSGRGPPASPERAFRWYWYYTYAFLKN